MNEVLEMARQAGFHEHDFPFKKFKFEAFAKLVASAAIAKEREACAKLCEDIFNAPEPIGCGGEEYYYTKPFLICAAVIRARGEPTSRGETEECCGNPFKCKGNCVDKVNTHE
jgi:hypothetical protein